MRGHTPKKCVSLLDCQKPPTAKSQGGETFQSISLTGNTTDNKQVQRETNPRHELKHTSLRRKDMVSRCDDVDIDVKPPTSGNHRKTWTHRTMNSERSGDTWDCNWVHEDRDRFRKPIGYVPDTLHSVTTSLRLRHV
jgi:hypothetical protein